MNDSVFLHAEADSSDAAHVIQLSSSESAGSLIECARSLGVVLDDEPAVFIVDAEAPLKPDAPLQTGPRSTTPEFYVGSRVPIRIIVGYEGETAGRDFSPATRLRTVERWAARALEAPTKVPHRLTLRFADTVSTPAEDQPIGKLDINRDRRLQFDLIVDKDHSTEIAIIVNGRPRTVAKRIISFAEVVALAYPTQPSPNTIFDVTYRGARGPKPSGILAEGGFVKIKNRTTFNVTPTDKS